MSSSVVELPIIVEANTVKTARLLEGTSYFGNIVQ